MPRKKLLNVEGGIEGQGKVRKRRSSPSSSSSLVRKYRLKRAILVGKRGGGSTPEPTWRMKSRSPSLLNEKNVRLNSFDKGQELSVSARKLAAALWENNGAITSKLEDNIDNKKRGDVGVRKDGILKESQLASMESCLFDPTALLVPQALDRLDLNAYRRRNSVGSQKNLSYSFDIEGCQSCKITNLVEVDAKQRSPRGCFAHGSIAKSRLKEAVAALTACKGLLKVLSHMYCVEAQQCTNVALLSALKAEIDRACIQVNRLIHDTKLYERFCDHLLVQFELEKANWKIWEKDRFQSALRSMAGDHEVEKKLKHQTERLNKKLGEELADTKAKLSMVTKKLESERRANEILEQVCDELAMEMGKDKAEVEKLKRESAKVRAEVQKEREMLQLADVLREERVQMKLLEAKFQFEEKNAIVEKLKSELEAYLSAKVDEQLVDGSPNYQRIKELENYLRETLPVPCERQSLGRDAGEVQCKEEKEEAEGSAGSDLHSIELIGDDNSKSYIWGKNFQDKSKMEAINHKIKGKGRESISEEGPRQRISFGRQTSDGTEWEFSPNRRGSIDALDGKGSFEIFSETWKKGSEDEIERYNMIKDLRDNIVFGSKMAPSQEVSIPNEKQNNHSEALTVSHDAV